LAVEAVARAGFDPGALARYIGRVQTQRATKFSTLPTRDERVTAMRSIEERLPVSDYWVTSGEFVAIQREVRRLTEKALQLQ
jgi:predicted Zn-dependent protease